MVAQYRVAHDGIYGVETFGQIFAGEEFAPFRALKSAKELPFIAFDRHALADGKATTGNRGNLFGPIDPPSPNYNDKRKKDILHPSAPI